MPEFVLERSMKILNRFGKPLKGSKILVLGAAYKQDIDDVRESPALNVIHNLVVNGADLKYYDPFVPQFSFKGRDYVSVNLTENVLCEADLIIITTMHTVYDYNLIQQKAVFVFDTKNAMKDVKNRNNIETL
jgi:UDP-N-acetyl-D-glucosamine dehydrogenase